MAEPGLALHKALFAKLGELSVSVYDAVPQNTGYPYVTVDTSLAGSLDTLNRRVDERFVYLNVWSETRGQEEVLEVMGEIDALMDGVDLNLDTGSVVTVRVDRKTTQRDADNVTFMGTVTLRIITHH